MSEAPVLSEEDIREEVEALHQKPHRALSTALRGQGQGGELTIRVGSQGQDVPFVVEAVTSELALRRALWRQPERHKILLVDGVTALPHDLAGRLASGTIREVTAARRLARLFAATAVSPLLATSPVGRALLEPSPKKVEPIQGSTVDLETGLRALLARAELPTDGALSEERLLAFVATHPMPAHFARQLGIGVDADSAKRAGETLRAAIGQLLGERHGRGAALAFEAWCRGQGRQAAALIFVLEAAAGRTNNSLRALLLLLLKRVDPGATDQTLRGLSEPPESIRSLAARLHLRLGQDTEGRGALLKVLTEADQLLPDAQALELLDDSVFLPSSFERGLGRLARSLSAALDAGTTNAAVNLAACRKELDQLFRHVLVAEDSRQRRLDHARMAARLVAWLSGDEPEVRSDRSLGGALAVEVGLVERALRASAGLPEGPLRAVVERASVAARRRREALLDAFSRALTPDQIPEDAGALAPEGVLGQVVIPFLQDKPWRRLLVVLVPGLTWADAHELLELLERDEQPPQAMLSFRAPSVDAEAPLPLPPLVGAWSVQEMRSRILAGRVAAPGQILDEPRDPQRFAGHEALRPVVGAVGAAESPLYLPAQETLLEDGGQKGVVAQTIASPRRLVAVGLPGAGEPTRRPEIRELLRQASEAGRATLLVSCGAGESDRPAVWPLLLLGSAWLETLAEDPEGKPDEALQLLAPPRLPFWQLEVPPRTATKPPARPPARPTRTKQVVSPNQMALLGVPAAPVSLREQLQKLFVNPTRPVPAQALAVVEALYQTDSGVMSEEDLGRKMNVFGPRVGGLVARASEVVSQDGSELLTYDHHARMARLNKPLLAQLLKEANQ